jgi:hypothetical protein
MVKNPLPVKKVSQEPTGKNSVSANSFFLIFLAAKEKKKS